MIVVVLPAGARAALLWSKPLFLHEGNSHSGVGLACPSTSQPESTG
jgi:hypothetical protein